MKIDRQTKSVSSSHKSAVTQLHLRYLVRTFSTQALDYAPHCCQISTYHSQYPCYSSLSSASILSYLRSSLHPVSFTAIVFPRAMSSPCYHYPPRSTEPIPIPLVLHHVVLRILPHHRCHLSLLSYPLALILSLFIIVVVLNIYVTNRSIEASQEFGP